MSALERLKVRVKTERQLGRQLPWRAAFAVSKPSLMAILDWFDFSEYHLTRQQMLERLAEYSLAEDFDAAAKP